MGFMLVFTGLLDTTFNMLKVSLQLSISWYFFSEIGSTCSALLVKQLGTSKHMYCCYTFLPFIMLALLLLGYRGSIL